MAAMNLVLATGRVGREGCGYAMITGQGNDQGGREHGQNAINFPVDEISRTPSTASTLQKFGEFQKIVFQVRD